MKSVTEGVGIFNDLVQFAAHLGATGLSLFAAAGATASGRGAHFFLDVNTLPFSLRFVIFSVIAAAMGWAFGALVTWLTKDQSEKRMALAILVGLVTAGLLVFSAEWLARPPNRSPLPELELFGATGLLIAFWVICFQYRMHADQAGVGVLRGRAVALFTFAMLATLLLAISLIGVS